MECWHVWLMERGMTGNGIIKGVCECNMQFHPRSEHGKVILCANNQYGSKFREYFSISAQLIQMKFPTGVRFVFKSFVCWIWNGVPKRKCTNCLQFVDAFTIEHAAINDQGYHLRRSVCNFMSESVFHKGNIQANVIKMLVSSHTPGWRITSPSPAAHSWIAIPFIHVVVVASPMDAVQFCSFQFCALTVCWSRSGLREQKYYRNITTGF